MIRDEKKISSLHRNEFTVFDVYQSNGTVDRAVDLFVELLKALEQKLDLPALSGLEFKYTTHAEFAQEKTNGMDFIFYQTSSGEHHFCFVFDFIDLVHLSAVGNRLFAGYGRRHNCVGLQIAIRNDGGGNGSHLA